MKHKKTLLLIIAILVFALGCTVLDKSQGEAEKSSKKTSVVNLSQYAGRHSEKGIKCADCHGKAIPTLDSDSTVENQQCLICHGPMEKLAKKSEPKDFPDDNPHKSHLGDIACTVCHHEHSASRVYCLDCHPNFKMKIPGGEIK
ncbi:MAG: cytochrome c3 family protein [Syntrophales bacterium]|jgi:hypothetical protein